MASSVGRMTEEFKMAKKEVFKYKAVIKGLNKDKEVFIRYGVEIPEEIDKFEKESLEEIERLESRMEIEKQKAKKEKEDAKELKRERLEKSKHLILFNTELEDVKDLRIESDDKKVRDLFKSRNESYKKEIKKMIRYIKIYIENDVYGYSFGSKKSIGDMIDEFTNLVNERRKERGLDIEIIDKFN